MSNSAKDLFESRDHRLQQALRERVDAYFAESGRSPHANAEMVGKTVFFLAAAAGSLALLVSGVLPALVALPVCLFLGALLAGIGFNVGHDAIHGAWSSRPWVNRLLGHSFDLIGASSANWARAHNVVHHTFTNVTGVDTDLEPGPWLRFYQRPNPAWAHRFQHVYAPAFYCLTALVWVLKKDFSQVREVDPRTGKRPPLSALLEVVAWKAVHVALFLALPLWLSGYAWWQVAIGWVAMHAVAGLTLATIFQLAHVVEQVEFPSADGTGPRYPWAEHQLRTTSDFAPKSRLVAWLVGGLNRQVEHHLFARVCHVHYPALAPLVREVALAHGVPYYENPTFAGALGSHFRMLKRFGQPVPA